jgi:hypothetical protein
VCVCVCVCVYVCVCVCVVLGLELRAFALSYSGVILFKTGNNPKAVNRSVGSKLGCIHSWLSRKGRSC